MGIQGLLPLLKSIQQQINISELAGSTVGVDVYCWLHKGAYGCAFELAQGNDSDAYIKYVMRRVNMMLYYKVKPILVFDGGYLPSKSEKEAERREKRKENKSQGLVHLKNGNKSLANDCFQKSIDITPEMALNVMKACREKGVDCIVAPYEADAQLAYLMKTGIVQCIISEDSDLLVYGCEKVIFKMDANGLGQMIDLKQLPKLESLRMDGFTQEKFRQMCILSGCDYLQSVKGMGLMTAHKMLRTHSTVKKLISTLRLNTKMNVPRDYEARFEKAEQTFLYQIVFDPKTNKLVPLNPLPDDLEPAHLFFAGHDLKWKQEHALDLAIGNLNPLTGVRISDFKLTKALSLDEHADNPCSEKEKKSCMFPQVKKSPSLLFSNKTYEAEKNLNGAFRETKSSEKAKSQFVTPVRSKRSREKLEAEEREKESSKLARLYSTSMDEVTVDVSFETNETTSESAPQLRALGIQPKIVRKQRHNPFSSRVIRKPQSEEVMSRYFGLAGMEISKNETSSAFIDSTASTDLEDDTEVKENTRNETRVTNSQVSTIMNNESLDFSEHEDPEFQESGYLSSSQPIENSPTDNGMEPNNSPPFSFSSPPLSSNTYINTPPLPKFPMTPKSRKNKKQKTLGMKSLCKQMSLDMFAYVKGRAMTEGGNTETTNVSPKRPVLAHRSPPNCTLDRKLDEALEDEIEDENKKENCRNVLRAGHNDEEDMPWLPCQRQEQLKINNVKCPDTTIGRTEPKTIGVRTKPTTGLGRCRAVGLSRQRKTNKDTKKKTNNTIAPLLDYFAYRGRERTPRGIIS